MCKTDHNMSFTIVVQKIAREQLEAYLRYCNFTQQPILSILSTFQPAIYQILVIPQYIILGYRHEFFNTVIL